jgi:hypothetical protein
MAMLAPNHRIAYFPVPKAACTSVKKAMWELQHGTPFRPRENQMQGIQNVQPTTVFSPETFAGLADYWKFAVLRDPFSRIISTYTNKMKVWGPRIVARHGIPGLSAALSADGIPPRVPTLIEFCLFLEGYRKHFLFVRHHTDPFETFLGPDLSAYDALYRMEDLPKLASDISLRTGSKFVLPHANKSNDADRTMNDAARDAILAYTAPDYAYLAKYYAPSPR